MVRLAIEGFVLRPLQAGDLPALKRIWADAQVMRFLPSQGRPLAEDEVRERLHAFVRHWESHGYGVWAVVAEDTGDLAGYCGFRYLEKMREVELLYGLAPAYWGRGIASAAVKAVLAWARDREELARLMAMVSPGNIASRRVLEKAGFHFEKRTRAFDLEVLYYGAGDSTSDGADA